jgi:hypothetical protein
VSEATKLFAVVELFGHARIAGQIGEQTIGGVSFVRVDVPEVRSTPWHAPEEEPKEHVIAAHTRSFGAAAIYSINWCDEETARVAAHDIQHEPLKPYSLRTAINNMAAPERHRLLTARRDPGFDFDDDDPRN